MINTEKIEDRNLRTFLEGHPDAKLGDIIEFCKRQFLEEFMPSVRNQIDLGIDKNSYRTRILNEIAPYERETEAYRKYYQLADIASQRYDQIMFQVINLLNNHDKNFAQALRGVFEQEMAEIGMTKPSEFFEASRNSIMGNAMKEAQDSNDRKTSAELTEDSELAKKTVYEEFRRLLSNDLRNYGMNLSGRRGNFSLEIDPYHKRGAQTKLDKFAIILRESKDLFSQELPAFLLNRNNRIFEEFQEVRSKIMKMLEEAVRAFARERQDLSDSTKPRVENNEGVSLSDSVEAISETNQQAANQPKLWLADYKKLSNPMIKPTAATVEVYMTRGISRENCILHVWDRYVRTRAINAAFEANRISEDEMNRQLALVDRVQELLFDGLIKGRNLEDIRSSCEIGAALESDFGILEMKSNDFWKSGDAEIFNNISIVPETDTVEKLKSAGIPEKYISLLIWDTYCRNTRISIAFDNGRITEEEKQKQLELVTKVTIYLQAGLRSGKTMEEARQDAEALVMQELANEEKSQDNTAENSQGKDGLADVTGDPTITLKDLEKVNDVLTSDKEPKGPEQLQS